MRTTGRRSKAVVGLVFAALLLISMGAQEAEYRAETLSADEAQLRVAAALDWQQVLTITGLEELKSICVIVDQMNNEFAQRGVTADSLRTKAELELRKIGLNVIPAKNEDPDSAALIIKVVGEVIRSVDNREQFYVFAVRLDLVQAVRLRRDPRAVLPVGTTWSRDTLGIFGAGKSLQDGVNRAFDGLMDSFLNDYLKANPVRPSRP